MVIILLRIRLERYIRFSVEETTMTRDGSIPLLGVVDDLAATAMSSV